MNISTENNYADGNAEVPILHIKVILITQAKPTMISYE